ncbi:hypothetical protein V2J09_004843 [Rumex salicifolius]
MSTPTAPPSISSYNRLVWCPSGYYARLSSLRPMNFYPFLRQSCSYSSIRAIGIVNGEERAVKTASFWEDEKPYEILPGGEKSYFDEQDVVTFLDPPRELIPNDLSSYNPAFYLWKKIDDIPAERRLRLILLLYPRKGCVYDCRLISAAWAIAGARYNDDKLTRRCSSELLSAQSDSLSFESWHCRKRGGPLPVSLLSFFKMALFCKDRECYGRFIGGSILGRFANSYSPLYFTVRQLEEVMPTEQPCDLACELGDGLLDILDLPPGLPKPTKHPKPFDDHVVVYIRHVGPGVMVGQAWQEGLDLEQVPKKFCGEILMVKDYAASNKEGVR